MSSEYAVGIDFGTESARAVLIDVHTGDDLGAAVAEYTHRVLDRTLPGGTALGQEWALQDPDDWLAALETSVRQALARAGVSRENVIAVGIDFTSCTVLPVREDGTPLCRLAEWRDEPHAWPKLWKHHSAQSQAEKVNEVARRRKETWLGRYGGQVSAEWLLPKALEILQQAPDAYEAADLIVEGGDWVAWQLSGGLARNACAAGFKALWHKRDGYPGEKYLQELDTALAGFYASKGAGPVVAPGTPLGSIKDTWAERLGLSRSTQVAVGIVDAHAGLVGVGVSEPGVLYLATGTSTCHLVLSEREVQVPGIAGVVEDGIIPGWFGYEAGQAAVGDMLAWYVAHVGASHSELSEEAASLRPGESGLLALDWWQGSRTPLVDADLSGGILGYTLGSSRGGVYRALVEATALGTRMIVDGFIDAGVAIDALCAGGTPMRNDLLVQIYADVLGAPLAVSAVEQPSARGAAVLGAVAGGAYASVAEAVTALAPPPARLVTPNALSGPAYAELYDLYRQLVRLLGGERGSLLKRLVGLRRTDKQLLGAVRR